MRYIVGCCIVIVMGAVHAESPVVFPDDLPRDHRLDDLRTLNGFFPFQPVSNLKQWKQRQSDIKRRILVSQGLWPLPTKTPLNAVIHSRVDRDDYVVDRVFFESIPGNYVTGSLYRPKGKTGPFPVVLSPHGHWKEGRFYDAGEETVSKQIKAGAEQFTQGGRFPLQARAVQLARMGCMVFHYDMTGYADAVQIGHRPDKWKHLDGAENWGFMSVQADLRLQNMMGLQTWNSIRAVDFVSELENVDRSRIGVTGASGGGTQSMILGAIDERIAASMPCVMVSTAMQGGCTCENAPLLRIGQGNIDIAAATAPRPLGLTAADDWTIELETKGYPDLVRVYELMGVPERITAVFHTQFRHNYNQVNRAAMYAFFNQYFGLGFASIAEKDFQPLSQSESTVWNSEYPKPSGDQLGDLHEIRLLAIAARDSDRHMSRLVPDSSDTLNAYRDVVGGAWETMLGRRADQVGQVVYKETSLTEMAGVAIHAGSLRNVDNEEEFPILQLDPADKAVDRGTVIWVTDDGKSTIFDQGKIRQDIVTLVKAGYRVVVPDLFGQGELAAAANPEQAQRMWFQQSGDKGWHQFSGYTFGFNHCLFAQRTHDLMSVVAYASQLGEVCMIGAGKTAGPLVAAACSQSSQQIERCIVDFDGFRFAELNRHDDPMFVPGAVKYFGVDGLVSLAAPASMVVFGGDYPVAKRVYRASGVADRLQVSDLKPSSKNRVDLLRSHD